MKFNDVVNEIDLLDLDKEIRGSSMITSIKTARNTSLTYGIPIVSTRKSAIAWIIRVVKSSALSVDDILLDDVSRSNDDGNSSITIDRSISEKELLEKCDSSETDIISVNATFKDCPIVVGVDLNNFKPFVTLRNNKIPSLDELEKLLELPRKYKEI